VIWALLAILGVPIWLIVGALGGALWNRRSFRAQDGVFPIALRPAGQDSWPRITSYGRLIHDVLVVNLGLALVRTKIYPVIDARPIDVTTTPKHLEDALGRMLVVEGHGDIEVAVPVSVAQQLDELGRAPRA
jgi:hypothetical protein